MVTIPTGTRPGDQFRVSVNGQELLVTCPENARPGTNVRIYPPQGSPHRPSEPTEPIVQTFEVQVPSGVQPGQPFALIANNQRVLVTCPLTAGPGQRIRFQLPVSRSADGGVRPPNSNSSSLPPSSGSVDFSAIRLTYDKDGWSRCVSTTDSKFHWVLSTQSADEGKSDLDNHISNYAVVRSMNFNGEGGVPGQGSSLLDHGVRLSLGNASEVAASCVVSHPSFYYGGGRRPRGDLFNHVDIARACSLPFKDKIAWFRGACDKLRTPWENEHTFCFVRREHLMDDSLSCIMNLTAEQMRNMFRFEFINEPGIDAGGVAREWFQIVTERLFHPDFGLWQYSAVNQMCMQISACSSLATAEHLKLFRFTGRVIGKALFDGQLVACHMIRHIYKHILGWPLMMGDIEMIDAEVHKSLMDVVDYDNQGMDVSDLCLDFTVTEERMGETQFYPLIEGGEDIDVTSENLKLFLESRLKYQVLDRVKDQLKELLIGFYEVVPEALLIAFDFQELELLMCGLPEIEMKDWKVNTEYMGQYESSGEDHKVCKWFWEVVEEFDEELKARLLQFVTGTSGVPAQGFAYLQGNDGNIRKFCVNSISVKTSLFPRAHTCFNRIDLPLYPDKATLKDKLTLAVQLEHTGFDID